MWSRRGKFQLVHKFFPFEHEYDPDLLDAIAHLRVLDGCLPGHAKHVSFVNCFAPFGTAKYWVKSS